MQKAAATRVLSIKPDDALAHWKFGNVLRQQGKPDLTVSFYRRAIALQPNMPVAHKNLGLALCENGLVAESMISLRRQAELIMGA